MWIFMWFESLCFNFIQIQKMSQHFWNSGCISQFLLNLHFSAIVYAVCWCMIFLCISSHIDSCAFLYTRWWGERLGQRKRLHHRAGSGPYGAADVGSRQKRPSATSRRGGPSADAFSAVTIRCNSPHMAAAAVEIMAVGGTQPHGHLKQTQHRSRC